MSPAFSHVLLYELDRLLGGLVHVTLAENVLWKLQNASVVVLDVRACVISSAYICRDRLVLDPRHAISQMRRPTSAKIHLLNTDRFM